LQIIGQLPTASRAEPLQNHDKTAQTTWNMAITPPLSLPLGRKREHETNNHASTQKRIGSWAAFMIIDRANDAQLDPPRPTQIAWANRLIIDGPIYFLGQRLESSM
jgi:hypothetical protein